MAKWLQFKMMLTGILVFSCTCLQVSAQISSRVNGVVTDTEGEALPGVHVSAVKSSDNSGLNAITDVNGVFSLPALAAGEEYSLTFTYLGYQTQTIRYPAASAPAGLTVKMEASNTALDQVVVTALGIKQEKKALGYSVQEVKGSSLNEARDNNFVNSLSGKIAGVNIISGTGVGSSARITIRGESSLNYQKNQPLIIVDGIPVGNDPIQNSTSADFGSSIGEINPADIESVNVLKGAAAAALYGSRAANGAIVVTTKTGKGQRGLGFTYTNGYTWETPLVLPKFQNSFGGGENGNFTGSNFGYSNGGLYQDGNSDGYDESWGPRLDGSLKNQFDSPTSNGFRGGDVHLANRGDIIPTPWIAQPDGMAEFFETGHNRFNSLAMSGAGENASFRFSYTNNDQKGIVPNNDLKRNSFKLNTSLEIADRIQAEASVNYTKSKSANRTDLGYGRNTPMYFFTWMTRNVNINSLRNYWQPGLEGIQQYQYNYGEDHNNPFFYQYENTIGQDKDQLYGNIKLSYNILDNLSLMVRGGTDYFNDFRPRKISVSSVDSRRGSYSENDIQYQENNYDFLLSYRKKEQTSKIDYNASFGGNSMERIRRSSSASISELLIPGIYNLGNKNVPVEAGNYAEKRVINSFYGLFQTNYDGKVFLDVTGRTDWSSTLPAENNSYFYPSVSSSVLLNEIWKMSPKIDLFKLRLAYAEVGNDTDPYQLYSSYYNQQLFNGLPSLVEDGSLKGGNTLKPERSRTIEFGSEIILLKDRLGLDLTWYKSNSKDQILGLQLPSSSGYGNRVINTGELSNTGFELMMHSTPIKLANSFQWNLNVNFARNVNKVISLAAGVDKIVQAAPGEDATLEAKVGDRLGELYGPGFERVKEGAMKGTIIIGSNGRPRITANPMYLGNVNPDWTAGITNRFAFKGVYLEGLLDINKGGVFLSRFLNKAAGAGQLAETAEARLSRPAGQEYDPQQPYFRDGAALMPDGSYERNLRIFDGTLSQGIYGTNARDYYKRYYDHNSEAQLMDRSFVKLRELKLGYTFPKSLFKNVPIQQANLSLVGRNILLWTKNDHFDPEAAASTGNGLIGGFENMGIPSTKSIGFNLNVSF